jgi:hypothetical protein
VSSDPEEERAMMTRRKVIDGEQKYVLKAVLGAPGVVRLATFFFTGNLELTGGVG